MTVLLPRDALGLGLRRPHHAHLFAHWPAVDYFEAISENFLTPALPPRERLDAVRARYPVVLHGVGLNLLGHARLDEDYLDALCRLADRIDAPFVSDHLCWTGARGISHHDLLPTPYVPELVALAAERAAYVQRRLGRPFGIENLSSYVTFERSTMTEWDFYAAVVRASGCSFMLDVNNIFVSSHNHGFDPEDYLRAIDFSRVLQVHIAGHSREADGTLVDTHDHPVPDPVWSLYARAWRLGGPFPTLLEWDERIPPMPEVLAELARAKGARATPTPAPDWLATQQDRFSATLRTPLDRTTGTLRATLDVYDPDAVQDVRDAPNATAAERLAVYNRQYWYRLFGVMQTSFPITTRLLGHWRFNDYADRFLRAHPPRSWALDRVPDGFESFFAEALDAHPARDALVNAARIDTAWRELFRAPAVAPFHPTTADAARLLDARLVPSPATAVVVDHFALLELKATLATLPGEAPVPVPARLSQPRWWMLLREPDGVRQLPLAPLEGELLSLLSEHPVRDALARLEAACPEAERATLPAQTQRWLARSVERGFWAGIAPDDGGQGRTQV